MLNLVNGCRMRASHINCYYTIHAPSDLRTSSGWEKLGCVFDLLSTIETKAEVNCVYSLRKGSSYGKRAGLPSYMTTRSTPIRPREKV
jgi:hypothetical protein